MAIDLSSLPTDVNSIANLVMVNPQTNIGIRPQDAINQNSGNAALLRAITGAALPAPSESFLFDIPEEDKATSQSDITDHYVEDNTALNDHISLKPVEITLSGFIGELNNVPPPALAALKSVADKLTMLGPYQPQLSVAAQIAYNNAAQVYQAAVTAANALTSRFDSLGGVVGIGRQPIQTKQQKAYIKLFTMQQKRQLFTVQTPWAIFEDMAIKSLTATQAEDTRMITSFDVTFKKMRFATTILSQSKPAAGRAGTSAAPEVDRGTQRPADSTPFGVSA